MAPRLDIQSSLWIREARGADPAPLETITVELRDGALTGRGEAVPAAGEGAEEIAARLAAMRDAVAEGLDRAGLGQIMPLGAARGALDIAFWDLEAKQRNLWVWELAGIPEPRPLVTSFRLDRGTPASMRDLATTHSFRPVLRVELAAESDLDGLIAVHEAAPQSRIIVAMSGDWTEDRLDAAAPILAAAGVVLVERHCTSENRVCESREHTIPLGVVASSVLGRDLASLAGQYRFLVIDLPRIGGLTAAFELRDAARAAGLEIVVDGGCGSSLAMAPAHFLAQDAAYAHLDGPLHLTRDRQPGLRYEGSSVYPPKPNLWG